MEDEERLIALIKSNEDLNHKLTKELNKADEERKNLKI